METGQQKILITGSDGFIAKNLIVELRNRGYKNIFLCNRNTTEELLKKYASECDAVVHLAGVNRPDDEEEYERGNVLFTETVISYLSTKKQKVTFIFASSIQAELDNAYGISKRRAEELLINYAKEHDVALVIYRLPNIFGKWCKPYYNSVIATFCYNIARGKEVRIDDSEAMIELGYVDDVVEAFINDLGHAGEGDGIYRQLKEVYHQTVGRLASLIRSYTEYDQNLGIPDLLDPFVKKLYSTYLSYLKQEDFKYSLKMNTDSRGSFTEFIRTEVSGQVSVNIISKPGITKGNHWHHTKVEKFLVVKGQAVVRFRHVLAKEVMEYQLNGEKLEVIHIPPGYIHNIINTGTEELIVVMWSNEPFNKDKPDTYYEEL